MGGRGSPLLLARGPTLPHPLSSMYFLFTLHFTPSHLFISFFYYFYFNLFYLFSSCRTKVSLEKKVYGRKNFVSGADKADYFVVLARSDAPLVNNISYLLFYFILLIFLLFSSSFYFFQLFMILFYKDKIYPFDAVLVDRHGYVYLPFFLSSSLLLHTYYYYY